MVEQLDGLGLVYEKQGNTGAAAYEQSNRVDPFARVTNQLAYDLQREQRKIEVDQEKKDRANLDVLKGLGDIKGWEIDNQAFIYNEANQLKNEAQQLVAKGKNLTDLFDPEVRAFNEKSQKLAQQAPLSVQQGKVIEAMKMDLMKNPQKYDTEETRKALEAYSAMKPNERMNTPVESLFVPKYNKYSLLPKLPEIAKWSDPVGSRGEIKFNEQKARTALALNLDTEEGERDYNIGVKKGDWTTPEEMIEVNLAKAKTQFQERIARYIAQPSATAEFKTPVTRKEIAESIRQSDSLSIPFYKYNPETKATDLSDGAITTFGVTDLPNINLTITSDNAASPKGKKFTASVQLQSGNMGVALYNKKDKTYQKDSETGIYTIDGEEYTLEEAISKGLLEYKPILQGLGKYNSRDYDVIVDPTKYAQTINSTEPNRKFFNMVLAEQQAFAAEKNAQYKKTTTSTTTTKPTTGTSGEKPKEATKPKVTAAKKEIKRSEIAAKAAAAGYTTAEYEKMLKDNGITIIN